MPASRTSTSPYPDYDIHKVIQAVRNPTPDLVNVFAHRGVRLLGGTTENSLTAIAAAARAGYEGIEIDLRLTKDKRVVVFHDAGLGRLTDVKLPKGETYSTPSLARATALSSRKPNGSARWSISISAMTVAASRKIPSICNKAKPQR